MRVIDIITGEKPSLSFEVFPPKTSDNFESIRVATENIAGLNPSYMSVTYGAGGGTSRFTVDIAANIQQKYGVAALAHLSCISSTHQGVREQMDAIRAAGIENVLALRGDLPSDAAPGAHWDYRYSTELIRELVDYGGFCIGAACYPEGHPESPHQKEDVLHLKEKVDAGCQFLVTQMFFDNNLLYNFLYKIREAGITVPVVAGIMPVTNARQIGRIVALSGCALPQRFRYIVDRFGSDDAAMRQAGIAYATEQIVDLYANGINAVHVYSMNNAAVAAKIQENLSDIIK